MNTREQIKENMIRTAARQWGLQENEIETNFDPLIVLLIEALAAELEKIGHEIGNSEARLLSRLADMLLPEAVTGPRPASCILQATPVEASAIIAPEHSFSCSLPGSTGGSGTEINFLPIGNFTLVNASPAFIFSGNNLYGIGEKQTKELLYSGSSSASNTLGIAIASKKELKDLQGLQIYIHLRNSLKAPEFFSTLKHAEVTINNQPASISNGFALPGQFKLSGDQLMRLSEDKIARLRRMVAAIYQDNFISLTGHSPAATNELPEEWGQLPTELKQQLQAMPLVYLQVKLPRAFKQEIWDNLQIHFNAFPALNYEMHKVNHRASRFINIVPLPVDDLYLDVHSIQDTQGNTYKCKPGPGVNDLQEGEAIVKSSGIGQTSSKDIREMTARLADAIRDKNAFFGEINNDLILSRLAQISKTLSGIEDKLGEATDLHQVKHYVLLRGKKTEDTFAITYSTTNGTDAHAVKAGTVFTNTNAPLVEAKETRAITSAVGGSNELNQQQRQDVLKQQLLSAGKLVTAGDIKTYCAVLFGSRLTNVEVSRGVQIGEQAGEGFKRTIDVRLTFDKMTEDLRHEVEYKQRELAYHLQENGSFIYPYRILVIS